MKRLSTTQAETLRSLQFRLEEAHEAYAEVVANARTFLTSAIAEQTAYHNARSEEWLDSEAADDYEAWQTDYAATLALAPVVADLTAFQEAVSELEIGP